MKNLGIIIIVGFLGISSPVISQQVFKEWAPKGSNWLYWRPTFSGEHFCVRIAHDRDTTVFNHKYKVFDVYSLQVRPFAESRYESLLGSYFITKLGDTVFEYCRTERKETYYVDKDIVGDTIYPYRSCDPSDTVWVRLDTVYFKPMYSSAGSVDYKMRVYSSNAAYRREKIVKNDTIPEFMPYKFGMTSYELSDNFNFHKLLVHKSYCQCIFPIVNHPAVFPEKFECYFDSKLGSFNFFGGQCWLRNAYMSSLVDLNHLKFSIFPNPASELLYIRLTDPTEHIYIIYDTQGRYIQSGSVNQMATVDISKLKIGTYYISLQLKNDVIGYQKFIKN